MLTCIRPYLCSAAVLVVSCDKPRSPEPPSAPSEAVAAEQKPAPPALAAAQEIASAPASLAPGVRGIALPDAPPDGVIMDALAYDPTHHRLWVPAGNTGSVDVIDTSNDHVERIQGFATTQMERKGKMRTVGPSSATLGKGVVYVGNRGDSSVCAIDAGTLARGACIKLEAMPDLTQYVASTKEVWVTAPRAQSIIILDAKQPDKLAVKTTLKFEGEPEGTSVDEKRGVFYTNLEDKDRTLALDLKTHKILHTWQPNCGEDGPKGLVVDIKRNFLMVACADHLVALDAAHDGKLLSRLDTGDGVDLFDYVAARSALYVGAARGLKLTVASLDDKGQMLATATVPTPQGARNPVATEDGVAFLTDAHDGRILAIHPE